MRGPIAKGDQPASANRATKGAGKHILSIPIPQLAGTRKPWGATGAPCRMHAWSELLAPGRVAYFLGFSRSRANEASCDPCAALKSLGRA